MNLTFLRRGPMLAVHRHGRGPSGLPELCYPLTPLPRVAVLGLSVRQETGIHVFPEWSARSLDTVRPRSLAGWRQDLDTVIQLRQHGHLTLAELSFPLIVFSTPDDGPLSERKHDLLWDHFQLPVVEQIRHPNGTLVAIECDARIGFHAVLPPALSAGEDTCPCGAAPRWIPVASRTLAAVAGD